MSENSFEAAHRDLVPFSDALSSARVFNLGCETLAWCRQHELFDRSCDAEEVVIAAVFAHLCAPEEPTRQESQLAAKFIAIFLNVDDAEPALVRRWVPGGEAWDPAATVPAYGHWLEEFEQLQRCSARLASRFRHTFRDYLLSRREEIDTDRSTLTVEQCWQLRSRTTFNEPYVDFWLVAAGRDHDALWSPDVMECRRLATEMIWLLNDLCSVEKDIQGGRLSGDLNVLHSWIASTAGSLDEAVDFFAEEHNVRARRFRTLTELTCTTAPPEVRDCIALLQADVEGNRAAHEATLRVRYRSGVLERLGRLERAVGSPSLAAR